MTEFTLDNAIKHHSELQELRAAYLNDGQEPPGTADLLAQIEAATQTEPAPQVPRVNAGNGTQQEPAAAHDFNSNFRRATRGG